MKATGFRTLSSAIALLLEVCWYGGGLFTALMAFVLCAAPWIDPPRIEIGLAVPVAFTVNADTRPLAAPSSSAVNVRLANGGGTLYFSPRSRTTAAAGLVGLIAILALGMWVVGNLRPVFRSLRAGEAFARENPARIRRVGWAFIVAALAQTAVVYIGTYYASTHFATEGLRYDARLVLNPLGLVCGAVVMIIAEVYREGTRLDEDQSLTV
jgi:hypothetical protein